MLKTVLLIAAMSVVLALVLVCEFNADDSYTPASHMMNVKRCAERLDTLVGSKIIFIGGSGCGFGIRSDIVSDHFKMPVVNTGTHACIGLRLQMEVFKQYISSGDIVIVIPEYSNYAEWFYLGNDETALQILNVFPQARKSCPFWQRLYLCQFIPKYYKVKNAGCPEDGPYSVNSLNEFGDVTCYDIRCESQKIEVYRKSSGYNPCVKRYIMSYKRDVEERGAQFILLPPALARSSFENNREFVDLLYSKFNGGDEELFSDIPEACSMPDSLYYDTPYHLTTQGVQIRSYKLIEQIERQTCKSCD